MACAITISIVRQLYERKKTPKRVAVRGPHEAQRDARARGIICIVGVWNRMHATIQSGRVAGASDTPGGPSYRVGSDGFED